MLRRFAWGVLVYNLAVIAWGAFVRASGSGAGCGSHWPTCNGEVLHRPERIETLIELTHRLTSGVAFLAVLALTVAVFRHRAKGHPARRAAGFSMAFMVTEAAVGAGLVLLELVADNASMARAGWIAVHLVNTFLLLGALTLTAVTLDERRPQPLTYVQPAAWLVGIGLVATLLVGVTGAITALGDTLFPAESLAAGLAADRSPTAHFLIRLRVFHPLSAVLLAVYIAAMAGILRIVKPGRDVQRLATLLLGLVLLQLGVGLLNLVWLAPTFMQLIHLLMADFVWIAQVWMAHSVLREAPTAAPKLEAVRPS